MTKNNRTIILLSVLAVGLLGSCASPSEKDKSLVTKRIQYDVPIATAQQDAEWWVQNIEGANREALVKDIFGRVLDGKVKAYDFFSYAEIRPEEVNRMLRHVDTVSVERKQPPYDLVDTVLVSEIRLSDITRLRFLEEWKMNRQNLAFTKTIIGICPLVARYTDSGEMRGYKPLFWVFFDKSYPGEMQLGATAGK